MVEKLKDSCNIPNWIIVLFFTLMVSIFTTVIVNGKISARQSGIMIQSIKGLEYNFDKLDERILRIENKFINEK